MRHPQTITTRDQFNATEFELGVIYEDCDKPSRACRYELTPTGWLRTEPGETHGPREAPGAPELFLPLMLISEPELEAEPATIKGLRIPDPQPSTAPEVTDEQRAAVDNLTEWADELGEGSVLANDWRVVRALLSPALTDPQPVLPNKPGWYQGFDKVAQSQVTIRLADNGNWGHGITGSAILANPERFAPFRRLVPEREPITQEQIVDVFREHTGQGVPITLLRGLLALANRADQ